MTDAELTAIEQRAAGATPGPWRISNELTGDIRLAVRVKDFYSRLVCTFRSKIEGEQAYENAVFICAARSDVPALLVEVRHLQATLAEIASTSGNARHIEIARAAPTPSADR
jgi:hypothetical protein